MILGGVLFLFGLIIGSFLNSFLWRYIEKISFKGRSMCPACKEKIHWYDNLPVLSWFLLSGKCRYCKSKISVQYPVVELLTGVSFAIVGIFSGPGKVVSQAIASMTKYKEQVTNQLLIANILILATVLFIVSVLILLSVYDFKTKEIPNGFNLLFFLLAVIYLTLSNFSNQNLNIQHLVPNILSALVVWLFFYSLVFFSKETWMGGGDAKFVIGAGLILGPLGTFLMVMIASFVGSVYGLTALGYQKRKNKKNNKRKSKIHKQSHEIPFGPFLALGTFVSLVFGPQIIDFYVKIVLGL